MRDLLSYLVQWFLWGVLTLWAVFTVSFFLMHAVPGSPFASERSLPPAIERQLRQKHHLDAPLHEQYASDLWRIVSTGDLGWSTKLEDYSVGD